MAIASSSRACSRTWVDFHWTAFRRCSSLRRGMTARWTSWARSWTPPVARVLSTLRTASGGSTDNELTAPFALLWISVRNQKGEAFFLRDVLPLGAIGCYRLRLWDSATVVPPLEMVVLLRGEACRAQ